MRKRDWADVAAERISSFLERRHDVCDPLELAPYLREMIPDVMSDPGYSKSKTSAEDRELASEIAEVACAIFLDDAYVVTDEHWDQDGKVSRLHIRILDAAEKIQNYAAQVLADYRRKHRRK